MITREDFLRKRREIIASEFSFLNPVQREAVLSPAGQTLILAGAGSGKTTVIVNRIACLIKYGSAYSEPEVPFGGDPEDDLRLITALHNNETLLEHEEYRARQLMQYNAPPAWAVMAITFTNKAAAELKERIERILGDEASEIWASTFHSACAKILRRESRENNTPYGSDFTIYDADDSKKVIKEVLKALDIDEKQLPVKFCQNEISSAKDKLISPEEYREEIAQNDAGLKQIARVYAEYQKRLISSNALDFDDIIYVTVKLFENHPEVLERYRRRFKYILVDEYQDTNVAQFKLVSLLAGENGNICVVGDDDQSIYKFRGATIENILNFDRQYPRAKVIRLEQNYRSTANILAAANSVIKNNFNRKGKTLWTKAEEGELITEYCGDNERDEAYFVGATILQEMTSNGRKASDFAILYRNNAQSNMLEMTLTRMGIGYRVIGGHRFYERKEIKDALSYLCVINNPADSVRLTRIINEPKRGIGDTTVATALNIAMAEGKSLFEIIANADKYGALSRASEKLMSFARMIESLRAFSEDAAISELYEEMLDKTGYLNMYALEKTEEAKDRVGNLRELSTSIQNFEEENENATLRTFLEEVALMSDIDNYDSEADACVMMTLHAAKGLEFPVVFIVGMEDGIFPSRQVMFDYKEVEEERRLAYVGITRAKKKLYLTRARTRTLYGQSSTNFPSRFLQEIDKDLLEQEGLAKESVPRFGNYRQTNYQSSPVQTSYAAKAVSPAPQKQRSIFAEKKPPVKVSNGDRVRHKVFGEGLVLSVTPVGADSLIEIKFEKVGVKKLMSNFAPLEKI